MFLRKNWQSLSIASLALFSANPSFAAGINFYHPLLEYVGIVDHGSKHDWQVVPAGILVTLVIFLLGLAYKTWVDSKIAKQDYEPTSKFNPANLVELIMDFIYDLSQSIIGHNFKNYIVLMAALFIFILFGNLSGLIPGFPPPTENLSTNLALAVIVFVAYNFAGIREHHSHYAHQFLGPVLWLSFMMIPIELISHAARPLSLSLRLYVNLYADHTILGLFSSFPVVNWFLPGLFMIFGLLVCVIQAFIFTLLTGIYISMAESHDH